MTYEQIMGAIENAHSKKSEKTKKGSDEPKPFTAKDAALQDAKEKGKPLGGKGHISYYIGKKINREKFMSAFNAIFNGELPIRKAWKISGLSEPTFRKRANQLCTDGFIPGYLVEDGHQIDFEVTPLTDYQLIERELARLEKRRK